MNILIAIGVVNWWSILIGAVVGVVLGFFVSELKGWFIEYRLKNKLVKAFKPYCGNYSVYIKGRGSTDIQSVTINHSRKNRNTLNLEIDTYKGGSATGFIIMDLYTLKVGQGGYYNTNKRDEDQSGFYNIILVKEGVIHAKLSYVNAKFQEINVMYIWTKNENN